MALSGNNAAPITPRLRASEKVRGFLREQLLTEAVAAGGRLPTIKEMSRHLNVSPFTVHAVVSELSKEGAIKAVPGRGLFTTASIEPAPISSSKSSSMILLVSIHEREFLAPVMTWGKEFCAAILREITNRSEQMMMRPFFVDRMKEKEAAMAEEVKQCDAAIVFPSPVSAPLIEELRRQGKPIVNINEPQIDVTSQFVALNAYASSMHLARCWVKAGRKNFAVLLHHPLDERGNCVRALMGFQTALQKAPSTTLRYESLDPVEPGVVDACFERLWAEKPPDAIYSSSANIVLQGIQWLLKRNIRIPEQVSLVTESGIQLESGPMLPHTTLRVPFREIGAEAVRMALASIKNPHQLQPGIFLDGGILPGTTTTAEENQLLIS